MAKPPVIWVTETALRERFRRGRYLERAANGTIIVELKADRHPSPGPAGEPFCTRSQMILMREAQETAKGLVAGRVLAMAHRYLRPDGKVGASGLPDPKRIYERHAIYAVGNPAQKLKS